MSRECLNIKRFSEYTKDEQKEIMFHWWYYYGKLPLSFAEMDAFKRMMDEDIDFVKNAALVAWARESTSQDLVRAMRSDLEEYKRYIIDLVASEEFKDVEELLESTFIEEMVKTYNKPEPNVPMTDEQLLGGLLEVLGGNVHASKQLNYPKATRPILTSEKVLEIYKDCLLKEEELVNGEPSVDFTIGEGVQLIGVFCSERLSAKKEEITSLFDELPGIDRGASFLNLCFDKHGRQWTGEHSTMDLLMQLGIATDIICYPVPRKVWPLIGGVPLVLRTYEKDDFLVTSHKPHEFKKIKSELVKGIYRKNVK